MCWKVLNIADLFCLHGNIRPGNTTISLFFGALKCFFDFFVFSVKISRLYIASNKLNFQNWQHWKCLIPKGPFKSPVYVGFRIWDRTFWLKLAELWACIVGWICPPGGGGVLALEMGRGVPPECLKPDPVPIRLAAEKTPRPNLEINTKFNGSACGVINTNIFIGLFKLFNIYL